MMPTGTTYRVMWASISKRISDSNWNHSNRKVWCLTDSQYVVGHKYGAFGYPAFSSLIGELCYPFDTIQEARISQNVLRTRITLLTSTYSTMKVYLKRTSKKAKLNAWNRNILTFALTGISRVP